jgi:hypothetical protein
MDTLIDNCTENNFEFVCPKKWDQLRKSYVEGVRYCDQCKRNVYLCRTDADIKLYDSLKYCIAISSSQYERRRAPQISLQEDTVAQSENVTSGDQVRFLGVWRSVTYQPPPRDPDEESDIPEFLLRK